MLLNFGVLILSALFIFSVSKSVNSSEVKTFRLPNETKPIGYDLEIFTNVHRNIFDFTGSVKIYLIAVNHTDRIVVHVKNLNIAQITLVDLANNNTFNNLEYEYCSKTAHFTVLSRIKPLNLVPENKYLLQIKYNSILSDRQSGFYKASYYDSDHTKIWLATTHLQPTYARCVFPCYDEPAIKAKFTITIVHGSNYSAISNMPLDGKPIDSEDGTTTTKFLETPPMSTYNVAFVVSNFEYIEAQKDNITQRIFHPPESDNKGQVALEIAQSTLSELQNYFGVNYCLPKIDHIGISSRSGMAMENWGLIIYREDVLFPKKSTNFYRVNIEAMVIAHEIAHQWFGNLVTLKWWTYVWLNEGFATYYGTKAIQLVYPELNVRDYILATEALRSWDYLYEQRITDYVETEREINMSFNKATYSKAAYVLQMFEHAISESTFKKGVTLYIRKFQFSTVEEDDFFDALQEVATTDSVKFFSEQGAVRKIMKSWVQHEYYPLVTVTRHYENGTFTLYQSSSCKSDDNSLWYIPITLMTANNIDLDTTTPDLIFPEQQTLEVNPELLNRTLLPDDWLVLNKDRIGLYRVNYDERNWKLITESLKHNPKSVPRYNRMQLITDCGFLLLHNQLKAAIAFEFLNYLKFEDDALVWDEAVNTLRSIYFELEETDSFELFKKYAGNLLRNKIKWFLGKRQQRLFSTDNEALDNNLLTRLFEFACNIGLEDCVQYARNKFKDVIEGNVELDEKIKKVILREGLKVATESDYKSVFVKLANSNTTDRVFLIECLAFSNDTNLIRYFLDSILDPNITYSVEERDFVIGSTAKNPDAFGVVIDFIKENHNKLINVTKDLWENIAFMRHEVQKEEEKQAYLDLLEKVKYLGNLSNDRLEQIMVKDYPEFYDEQEEVVLEWLQNHFEVSNGSKSVMLHFFCFILLLVDLLQNLIKSS